MRPCREIHLWYPPLTLEIWHFAAPSRRGTALTASMHIFCAVVGAGVLALPQSVAWLGWIAGPLLIIVFYAVALWSSHMLSECYEYEGVKHSRYHHAVRHLLSERSAVACAVFQILNIVLTTMAYTITGAQSMQQISLLLCNDPNPDDCVFSPSSGGTWQLTLVFGAAELILSQVKNLEDAWWVSTVGTIGSIVYSVIALVLCLVHVSNGLGTIGGIPVGSLDSTGQVVSTSDKVFGILNALGSIAFAYNFLLILLEIEDTLREPPKAAVTMSRAATFAVTGSFVFYLSVAVAGYAAEGNTVAGIILQSFDGPVWALIIAHIAVLLHMLTAYGIYAHAVYNTIESHVKWRRIRKAAKKGALEAVAATDAAADAAANVETAGMPTPFDAPADGLRHRHSHKHLLGFQHIQLEPLSERLSSALSGQLEDARLSEVLEQLHSADVAIAHAHSGGALSIARSSMYAVDTGFANEEVPLNEDNYLIPFWQRLILRSVYVLFITLIAAILPFFNAFAGLVGSVTFWPLAVYFPFACYRRVTKVGFKTSALMWVLWWSLLVVSIAATVGSVRTIVDSASTFQVFGT